uniref:Uncharacterized protein n=1 Tax=Arundo donax TaxID=35708 RepID=A0A0A9DP01_ARUDO
MQVFRRALFISQLIVRHHYSVRTTPLARHTHPSPSKNLIPVLATTCRDTRKHPNPCVPSIMFTYTFTRRAPSSRRPATVAESPRAGPRRGARRGSTGRCCAARATAARNASGSCARTAAARSTLRAARPAPSPPGR